MMIIFLYSTLCYNVIIVLSESMSHERRSILSNYGADVILSASDEGMYGSVIKANDMFHLLSDKVKQEKGTLDTERILFEFKEWLNKEVRIRGS